MPKSLMTAFEEKSVNENITQNIFNGKIQYNLNITTPVYTSVQHLFLIFRQICPIYLYSRKSHHSQVKCPVSTFTFRLNLSMNWHPRYNSYHQRKQINFEILLRI